MKTYQLKENEYSAGLYEPDDSKLNHFELLEYKRHQRLLKRYHCYENKDFSYKNKRYNYPIYTNSKGIYSGKYRLDPIFNSFKDIPFKIFMTFNFKGEYSYKNSHNKRVEYVESLIDKARKLCGNLTFNDIQPVLTEETFNGRYHIHILLFIKDYVKINLRKLVEVLYYSLDRSIIFIPHGEKRRKKLIQIVKVPIATCAYITKLKTGQLNKVFYIRNKNTERYKRNGSFQDFHRMYRQHGFRKRPSDDNYKPYTDLVKLLAA
jgi:hypothetical protein